MTTLNNLEQHNFIVENVPGFSFMTAARAWKTKYEDYAEFQNTVITNESYNELAEVMHEMWDSLPVLTVAEALQESNTEKRRVYFNAIGVIKLFKELEPELLDRQEIEKERQRWDLDNAPYTYKFKDIYELYRIPAEKLYAGAQTRFGRTSLENSNDAFAVRCWCTTTNREYWLYVPREAALGSEWWRKEDAQPDAIRAIAWTIRVDHNNLERIYRQGDIIVVKLSDKSEKVRPYHLTKEDYLSLMYSET